ncbi:DNA-binding transcriptional regulator, AcrR family [Lentzea waywayandensis]|uniref:DNA-binding transcriptional regulator, AcrR family n=1 Tax=Lentzea waywayandensis TaxID=84724 RepID=A0A1I6FIK4_9PSEU|nr:TetR/AcrR family transcriptional regulator [Lentzea waywayandensis]SFR29766.1 DNA-binding transcriptional regulator, AcrR family [Lentzea waywayandensis]
MPKSADRGRRTREQLIDAAAVLVGEVGWGAVTTRLVAERAGVNAALVHYHFSSVQELLSTAALRFASKALAESAEALRSVSPAEGVERIFADLSRFTGTDPESLLLAEAFLAAHRLPELRAGLSALVVEFRTGVAGWLRESGVQDADAVALLLGAAIDGLVLHRALDSSVDFGVVAGPFRRLVAG